MLKGCRHPFVSQPWIFRCPTLNNIGCVAIAPEQGFKLFAANAGQNRRVSNLIAIEVQNRQYSAITRWVNKFVRVPGSSQGAGFRFTIADHTGDNRLGIIESYAVGMGKAVAQLATLMNRARGFGGAVAADTPREGKLFKEAAHAFGIGGDIGINLAVSTLKVDRCEHPRRTVTRPRHVDNIEIVFADQAIEVNVAEAETR